MNTSSFFSFFLPLSLSVCLSLYLSQRIPVLSPLLSTSLPLFIRSVPRTHSLSPPFDIFDTIHVSRLLYVFSISLQSNYTCSCCHGYTGGYCEELDGCASHQCAEGAQCVDVQQGFGGHDYECQCPEGRSGVHCEVDVNECDSSPCVNGVCVDRPGAFQCYCVPGEYIYTYKHIYTNTNIHTQKLT